MTLTCNANFQLLPPADEGQEGDCISRLKKFFGVGFFLVDGGNNIIFVKVQFWIAALYKLKNITDPHNSRKFYGDAILLRSQTLYTEEFNLDCPFLSHTVSVFSPRTA